MMIMRTNRIILTLCLLVASVLGLYAQTNAHWQYDTRGFEYDMAAYFQLGKDNAVITDYADYADRIGCFRCTSHGCSVK